MVSHEVAPGSQWLNLGSTQPWLKELASLLAKGHARTSITQLTQSLNLAWTDSLRLARKHAGEKVASKDFGDDSDAEGPSDDENNLSPLRRAAFKHCPMLDMDLRGHTLTVLNSQRPRVVLLNKGAFKFLQDIVVDHFIKFIDEAPSQPSLENAPSVVARPAQFHFPASAFPNKRGKVTWMPEQHTWKLCVTKSEGPVDPFKDHQQGSLRVDPSLPADEYIGKKAEAYARACAAWNILDKSTKDRISTVGTEHVSGSSATSSATYGSENDSQETIVGGGNIGLSANWASIRRSKSVG